jgi:hypothetical protein
VASLQRLTDSLRARNRAVTDSLQAIVDSAGAQADLRTLFPRIQPALQAVRDDYVATIRAAERVLTPEQWQKLPEWLRNPSLQRGPGGPGGRGGRGGVRPPPGE